MVLQIEKGAAIASKLYGLPSEMRFEFGVDLEGDAVPGARADERVSPELFLQLIEWQLGDAFGVLAQRIHDERLCERAVSRKLHDVGEAVEIRHVSTHDQTSVRWK